MNKKLKVLPILAMGLMLVACNGGTSSSTPTSKKDDINFTLKVGSYVEIVKNDSNNLNTVAVSTAAVILKEDKIVNAYFDVLQAPFTVTDGTLALNMTKNQTKDAGDKVIETKQELHDRYAMKGVSQTEWYEHEAAFAKYIVGQTLNDASSANYESPYNTTGTVEVAGCTISKDNFTHAMKVITDTKTFKAPANTVSAGVGMKVSPFGTDGTNVLSVTIAGSATDKSGKVYETSLNAYQIPLMIDTTVTDTTKTQITYNPNGQWGPLAQVNKDNFKDCTVASGENTYYTEVLSKRELKDKYGMKSQAKQGEWYEQANMFAIYAKTKVASASELVGKNYKHYDEDTKTEVGDVSVTGCSIKMTDFATAISKSATNKSSATAK